MSPGSSGAAQDSDHRKRPRRRGKALDDAIFTAALEELAETGYANLTMEGVAGLALLRHHFLFNGVAIPTA